ncbi:hypothetical protein G6045_16315 [Streptomyces sp. YC504]|uniref:Peptidase n=1 Tax=Streptomyces mesophilus TaxID=1775132 RepID=A0A6G4XJ54_9ACTN|nr:hypothetical protein [Streptomyces mesophilus]NGO77212.1 hypothetical protein [Streptomyces mesophilus]
MGRRQWRDEGGRVAAGWGILRQIAAGAAAVLMVCAAPGSASANETADDPRAYGYDPKAKSVTGSSSMLSGPELAEGAPYRSTLTGSGPVYFRVALDARSNAYVSAVAVPESDSDLTALHSLQISIVDATGTSCDRQSQGFANGFAQPLAVTAIRTIGSAEGETDAKCQQAGTYYVAVSRSSRGAGAAPWKLDLRVDAEAPLKKAGSGGPSAAAPEAKPTGAPSQVDGGSGFGLAAAVPSGTAISDISAGRSRFYRVPVGWGQRLTVAAELAASRKGSYVASAVSVSVYNPARMHADTAVLGYRGEAATADVEDLPAVAYENRSARQRTDAAMRFPGWYYVKVTASPELATTWGQAPLKLSLRLTVDGAARNQPAYAGDPGIFQIPGVKPSPAPKDPSAAEDADSGGMKPLAIGAFGTGTLLLAVAGVRVARAQRTSP